MTLAQETKRRLHRFSFSQKSHRRAGRLEILQLEALEPRYVLTALSSFLAENLPTSFTAPGDDGHADQQRIVDASQDRDLVYLANAVSGDDLVALDRATSPLLKIYSRELQGTSLPMNQTTLWGTPWDDMFLSDGKEPLTDVYVDDVDAARPVLEQLGMAVTAVAATDAWQIVTGYLPPAAIGGVVATVPGLIVLNAAERGFSDAEVARDGSEGVAVTRASAGVSGEELSPQPRDPISGDGPLGGDGESGPEAQGAAANEWETVSFADQLMRILPGIDGDEPAVDGRIEVGVMSDTIDFVGGGISDSQASGDLPPGGRVINLDDDSSGIDEARAMAELIYDLVPDVTIIHHTAAQGSTDFANGIDELRAAGADVIADDFSYYTQPVFQDGVIAQAVDNVYLNHDVLMFGSAGNRNNESYYSTYSDDDGDNFHDFSPGDETIDFTLSNNEQLRPVLQWNQSWGNATTDIDIEIWNSDLSAKLADSNTNNIGGNPIDELTFTNTTGASQNYHLVFRRASGSATGLRLYMISRTNDDDFTDSYVLNQRAGISGNHAAQYIFSMGAVPWNDPNNIEDFSSHGPNTIYFSDAGNPITPFNRLKPDFTATDGNATTVPAPLTTFFGTSAASPNAAAVAALMIDAFNARPSYGTLSSWFADTAIGTGVGSWDAVHGEGRINALGAGMVANGLQSTEFYLELNPFGDVIFDQNLGGNTDTDRATFAFDNGGDVTIGVAEGDVTFDAAQTLWNEESGNFIEIDYDDGPGDDPFISRSLSFWTNYQVQVFSETDISAAASTDFTLTIDGPDATMFQVSLDDNGDGSSNSFIDDIADADYFELVAPLDMVLNRALNLSVDSLNPALDAVLTLYDSTGAVLQRSNTGSAGVSESINELAIVPGETYYVRVGSAQYASSGDFTLNVDFQTSVLPVLAPPVDGYAVFQSDGSMRDATSTSSFISFNGDLDAYWFAGDTGWSGDYTITASEVGSGVDTILAVYAETGEMIAFDDDGGLGVNSELTVTLSALTRYMVVVGDFGEDTTGDVDITIEAPTSSISINIPIGPLGTGVGSGDLFPEEDTDFRNFTAPSNADGTLTVTVTPTDPAVDTVGYLFDSSGFSIISATNGGPGAPDTLNFNGVVPNETYALSVLSNLYETSGTYEVDVEFGLALLGDFDNDGAYTCADVDALVGVIAAATNNPFFDLNSDALVNQTDLDIWLATAADFDGFGSPYKRGDANLDGIVDGLDFIVWNMNKFTSNAVWCLGDFTADGTIDGLDFIEWNSNKFTSSDVALVASTPNAVTDYKTVDGLGDLDLLDVSAARASSERLFEAAWKQEDIDTTHAERFLRRNGGPTVEAERGDADRERIVDELFVEFKTIG